MKRPGKVNGKDRWVPRNVRAKHDERSETFEKSRYIHVHASKTKESL
jgi:hypothetical protein